MQSIALWLGYMHWSSTALYCLKRTASCSRHWLCWLPQPVCEILGNAHSKWQVLLSCSRNGFSTYTRHPWWNLWRSQEWDEGEHRCIRLKHKRRSHGTGLYATSELGSWKRAVTTSDGCWQIRGSFSHNSTFVIRNYLIGALLWYRHLSMRGADSIIDKELYKDTAKSAEGFLVAVLFKKAHDEGCTILTNWQDQDSSSEKSFREVHGEHKCTSDEVWWTHWVSTWACTEGPHEQKSFTADFQKRHKEKFPLVESVSCCCNGSATMLVVDAPLMHSYSLPNKTCFVL